MHTSSIIRVALPTPLRKTFDYLVDSSLKESPALVPGVRVLVPFKHRTLVGLILELNSTTTVPHAKLKNILDIIDSEPIFSPSMLSLCHWVSDYYQHALGDVIFSALPTLLRKPRKRPIGQARRKQLESGPVLSEPTHHEAPVNPLTLNSEQTTAINSVLAHLHEFKPFLLDGITGSGKTEVYLTIIDQVIANGGQALVLVPEIGLTPQTLARFQVRFSQKVVALHSGLTDTARYQAWREASNGTAKIVIGTRSAVFTAFKQLSIIIVDEEHDSSFKQHEGLRYSARDVAVMRARSENIPIVLGSATPSLESLHNAWTKKYEHLQLLTRAGNAELPSFKTLDLRQKKITAGLSHELLIAIKEHLAHGNQVLLFLNRRGFAPSLLCHDCGWSADCKRCDAHLTVHQSPAQLFCHHCGFFQPMILQCPDCRSTVLISHGLGTEKLEHALTYEFPGVGIARLDRDSTKLKGSLEQILEDIHANKKHLLIGTQMLAKGHHFPNVTLVAIVDGDAGLFSSDFRAPEHMAQMILQVAGRAGRAEKKGEVLIQTHQPENPLLQNLLKHGYHSFMRQLTQEREAMRWPPFSAIALLRAESILKTDALSFLQQVQEIAISLNSKQVSLLGPIPTPMEKRANYFRAQLLLQAKSRKELQVFLPCLISRILEMTTVKKVRWTIDVDPLEAF